MTNRCKFTAPGRFLISLLLLQLVAVGPLAAATTPGFYEAAVVVEDRTATVRSTGLRQALAILLARISGDAAVAQRAEAAGLLASPERFVQQYQYLLEAAEQPEEPDQLQLMVVFDGGAVEQAMRQAGLPVWGLERPELLAWIAVEERGQRRLVSATEESVLRGQIEHAARQGGIPLLLPLMDIEDQAGVRAADVWGGFIETLRAPAMRYVAQGMLLGRISGFGENWTGRWLLEFNHEQWSWDTRSDSPQGVIDSGVEELARQLAGRLAARLIDAPPGVQLIAVEGVTGLLDFARIEAYLKQLTLVDDVALSRVEPGRLELYLSLNGGLEYLHQAVSLGGMLAVQSTGTVPVYRLQK